MLPSQSLVVKKVKNDMEAPPSHLCEFIVAAFAAVRKSKVSVPQVTVKLVKEDPFQVNVPVPPIVPIVGVNVML
jgi:hypothetical protein